MATNKIDPKSELRQMQFDMGFMQATHCSQDDQNKYRTMLKNGETLPEGVFQYKDASTGELVNSFYTVYDPQLSDAEKQEYIQYKKLSYLKTIKNCMVFFTVLTAISIMVYLLLMLASL